MAHQYERGQYFQEDSDPHVEGLVILAAGNIGYDGYRVAEKDLQTGVWRRYWIKARHLHDEVSLNSLKPVKTLGEDDVQGVEEQCTESDRLLGQSAKAVIAD